ncbi:hypothetical protein RRG08_004344 [Elysia crispata]|uniref:Uncharacterized protein n=1 Tax=Elysia crispata TaxID=231223 RepID=A0AAE1AY19_9GAST|nr:hypothetical protein RRG08_004344 [Elysia crispata]
MVPPPDTREVIIITNIFGPKCSKSCALISHISGVVISPMKWR